MKIQIPFLNSEDYDITVIRRITYGKKNETLKDKARIVEKDGDETDVVKFKSDGKEMPKPDKEKFEPVREQGILGKLLGREKRKLLLEVNEVSDDKFNAVTFDPSEADLEEIQMENIYENYRNIRNKRTIQAWNSSYDMNKITMGYLTALAIFTLAGMWVLTNGLESAIIEGVKAGIESGSAAGSGVSTPG